MFNSNFLSENFEAADPSFLQNDFPGFLLPGIDNFGSEMFPRDFQNFPTLQDFEGFDPSNFMQYFDQALQSMPDEMRQWMQLPFDCVMPSADSLEDPLIQNSPKPSFTYSKNKIGTLSQEERREKVLKFLEKRKRRNFKKKISYMCRKKVADQRIRVKGRFVSKVQASVLLDVKNEPESEI